MIKYKTFKVFFKKCKSLFPKQSAVHGQTESVLSSLLEVDRDISNRLIGMTQQELEIVRTAIDSVSSLLIEQLDEEEAAGTKTK